jgi:hypothetical protein
MNHYYPRTLAVTIALVSAFLRLAANSVRADVTVDNFHNFNPNALYASWASPSATILSGPTTWEVTSSGYGSLWKYEGDINGLGATQVRLTIDISGDAGVVAGPIVDLVDNNGVWASFQWYGQTAGSHILTANLSSAPVGFNFADIQHIHLECDPGGFGGNYHLTFRDLSLVTVPEPTSLTLAALGAAGLILARRRTNAAARR